MDTNVAVPPRLPANSAPLTPLDFLIRAEAAFPEHPAIIDGDHRFTWGTYARRCRMLAKALTAAGIARGDRVAVLLPNTAPMLEAHFGIPMAGAVICTINIRLNAQAIAYILDHSESRILIVDDQFRGLAEQALSLAGRPVRVIVTGAGAAPWAEDYDAFVDGGIDARPDDMVWPESEWDPLALNYTSGTTGNPKGVIYHHRGAYLNSFGQILSFSMATHPVYLWTLPMFHCNGWCFAWALAAVVGTHVCLRRFDGDVIWNAIHRFGVTHFCGAPTVLTFVLDASERAAPLPHPVNVMSGGALLPSLVWRRMTELGFKVQHVYGITEMHGIFVSCAWHQDWDQASPQDQARLVARQGIPLVVQSGLMVADSETLQPVPADGRTVGEVFARGNLGMTGYFKDPAATADAFAGGWYHTGDLAVVHPDGYLEIKDRLKDFIISGGENISSIEVEEALHTHPGVACAAVVALKDDTWGEVPLAFVELTAEWQGRLTEADLIAHCRGQIAHFKCPRRIVFSPVPRTATGKIPKFELRQKAARECGPDR